MANETKLKAVRGGDAIEHEIIDNLVKAWNDFILLSPTHPTHIRYFMDGINQCQQVMMWREMQRIKPKKYPFYLPNKK